MLDFELMRSLQKKNDTKIILLVLDGLGGMPMEPGGPTELEAAKTPILDQMAAEGTLGQTIPVRYEHWDKPSLFVTASYPVQGPHIYRYLDTIPWSIRSAAGYLKQLASV